MDFPNPNDGKAMQRFWGIINPYHRFLPGGTRILQPLTAALAGNPKVLSWLPDMDAAFAAAKAPAKYTAMSRYPQQHMPVPTRLFSHIHVDLVVPLPS